MPFDRFPGTTLAEDRAEEARERKRDTQANEFDQIMRPLQESITVAQEAARELKKRSQMIPYLGAETDCRLEAEHLLDVLDDVEACIRRSIKDAVED